MNTSVFLAARLRGVALLLLLGLAGFMTSARAETYPDRVIRIVVAAGPGGGLDTLVRLLKQPLEASLGQAVVVDNRPGASGIIAVQAVTHAPPDGYTILFVSGTLIVTNPFTIKNLPYKPLDELDAVAGYGSLPMVWVASPFLNFKNLSDMLTYARANEGKLLIAHGGAGTLPDLIEQAFIRRHGIKVQIIPYKTNPQADVDTMAGHVHVTVDNIGSVAPFVKQNQLTPLAVTTKQRAQMLPGVASWLEDDKGAFDVSGWYGFVAPKGTPRDIIEKLNSHINAAIQSPEAKKVLDGFGMQFAPQTPAEFAEFMRLEYAKFARLVQEIGYQPE